MPLLNCEAPLNVFLNSTITLLLLSMWSFLHFISACQNFCLAVRMFCTGVILVYQLVFDTILAALFLMHCNLRRLN